MIQFAIIYFKLKFLKKKKKKKKKEQFFTLLFLQIYYNINFCVFYK